MDKFIIVVGGVLGGVSLVLFNLFLTMFTISTLWGWFIVPLGVTTIGWAQAYGLALIISYLSVRSAPNFNPAVLQQLSFAQKIGRSIGWNLMVLFFGLIATFFM